MSTVNEGEQIEGDDLCEVEVLDGVVVEDFDAPFPGPLPEVNSERRLPARRLPLSVETAAALATGFVAGAATLALLRHHAATRVDHAAGSRGGGYVQSGHVRTFVVHVRPLSSQSH